MKAAMYQQFLYVQQSTKALRWPPHAFHAHWHASAASLHPSWLQPSYLRSLVLSTSHATHELGPELVREIGVQLLSESRTQIPGLHSCPLYEGLPRTSQTKDEPLAGTACAIKIADYGWGRGMFTAVILDTSAPN